MKMVSLLLALAVVAASQVTTSLIGTVTDPQGGAVPGAQVKVINRDTNTTFQTVTNERGEYAVASIPAASYRVLVSAQGFKIAAAPDVQIETGVPATMNIKLELGTLAETVEISGAAEVLQTATATVSSTLVGTGAGF